MGDFLSEATSIPRSRGSGAPIAPFRTPPRPNALAWFVRSPSRLRQDFHIKRLQLLL